MAHKQLRIGYDAYVPLEPNPLTSLEKAEHCLYSRLSHLGAICFLLTHFNPPNPDELGHENVTCRIQSLGELGEAIADGGLGNLETLTDRPAPGGDLNGPKEVVK